MHYSKIKNFDIANGDGIGVSFFVSGCSFHCKGCFNSETWPFEYGEKFTETTKRKLVKMIENPHIDHFSILGGEPFHPRNIVSVCHLIKEIKSLFPSKKIWVWTGYEDFQELFSDKNENQKELIKHTLNSIDYMTFGRFKLEKRNIKRKYSGSDNQYTLSLKDKIILEDSI